MSFDPILYNEFKKVEKLIMPPDQVKKMIEQESKIPPGLITYIDGQLKFWDITKSSINSKYYGKLTSITVLSTDEDGNGCSFLIVFDSNTSNNNDLKKIDGYLIMKRLDSNGIPQDINQPYIVDYDDSKSDPDNYKIVIKPIDLINTDNTTCILEGPQVDDMVYSAGSWQMILSQDSNVNVNTSGGLTPDYLQSQVVTLNNQINMLETYKTALDNAGYSDSDPEYIKTTNQLNYDSAIKDFYQALLDCDSCDPNDETTWNDEVTAADQKVKDAADAMNVPPPSTKEIIIQSIDKIGLSVMGSIDIYMTGHFEDAPDPTDTTQPDWLQNLSYTDNDTSHFKGKDQGFVGMNNAMGVNYAIFKGSYNANAGGTGYVSFDIDVAEAAGVGAQRQNYKYSAFSALFKIKERNFWDYTGGHKTWQYFVNMTPKTSDITSPEYGKFHIYCEVKAYKDYHNAIIGARWFATLNKFQGF